MHPKFDSEEFIYQAEKSEDYDSDEKIKGDDIEESSTLISPEANPVITEFTDVFPKDNILIPLEVTPVNMEFVDVFPEDLLDKLLPIRDI